MILFARNLGASATVLGLITGMMPLLVIFQIPAAKHIPRYGYKRFVYAGWGVRILFIFVIGLVPLAGSFLSAANQLALLLFLLFAFNLSRGISSCAWLPWITALVPASLRGTYLVRDAACVSFGSFIALLLTAWSLGGNPENWRFSAVFAFSGLMGVTSLVFLKRIPEGELGEPVRSSKTAVPWLEISRYAPFRKLLHLNFAWALAYGGMNAFTVAFLKAGSSFSEGRIIMLTSVAFLGGLGSYWLVGSRLDRLGSKPILMVAIGAWFLIGVGWTLSAGKVWEIGVPNVLVLQLFMGLSLSLVNMANTRLAMTLVPKMGRDHFFALFSVVQNLALGVAPVLWGVLIDAFGKRTMVWHGFELNRFSLFFLLAGGAFLVTLALCRNLEEPDAVRMEEALKEIFIQSPQRLWIRLWPR